MSYRVPVLERFAWQEPIISVLSTPPGTPAKGDRYIVGASATGDWVGQEDTIAWYTGTAWQFDGPFEGWSTYNKDDGKVYRYDGLAWGAEDLDSKMDLVPTAVENNIATFDAAGQVKDGGLAVGDIATETYADNAASGAVTTHETTYDHTKLHDQNTDQYLDFGGANQVSAAQAKQAYDNSHTQGTDQHLDFGGANQVSAAQAKEAYDKRAQFDNDLGVIFFDVS
jgi:hypothetical protein